MQTGVDHDHAAGCVPEPMLPAPWRVAEVRRETSETFTLGLEPVNGGAPMAFGPGQFNMLYLFGVGEVAISISGNPLRPGPLRHTIRAVGSVTRAMQELGVGDVIGVRGPYGAGWPLSDARGRDVVVIAGGLGLAPLRPLVHAVLARRKEFARVVLLYGARTPGDIPFKPDLRRWRSRSDLDVEMTVDRAGGRWDGDIGVVTRLVARAPFDPGNTVAYVCGPEVMMRFAVRELERRGVAGDRIHVSLERNMRCAVGFCGHCQYGPEFVCRDGPVFRLERVRGLLNVGEI